MSTPIKCLKYTPKYFSDEEFRRACPACSLNDMNAQFMKCLDFARESAGIPFVICSAYRSVEHELSKGRSGTSSHCKGIAVDIRCNSSVNRLKIVKSALNAGICRIGIHKNFVHLDSDWLKAPCIWLYDD